MLGDSNFPFKKWVTQHAIYKNWVFLMRSARLYESIWFIFCIIFCWSQGSFPLLRKRWPGLLLSVWRVFPLKILFFFLNWGFFLDFSFLFLSSWLCGVTNNFIFTTFIYSRRKTTRQYTTNTTNSAKQYNSNLAKIDGHTMFFSMDVRGNSIQRSHISK